MSRINTVCFSETKVSNLFSLRKGPRSSMGVYGKVPIELKRVIQLVDPQSPTMEKEVITPVHKHYKYLNVFAPVLGQSLSDLQQN